MKIKIIDFSGGALKLPERAHYNDAGADVFSPKGFFLAPGKAIKLPLGFGVEIPDGFMGSIYPRTSLAAQGITSELCPIDSGYRGEVHAILHNRSDSTVRIDAGDKLAQLVVLPVRMAEFVTELGDERGDGAFGSTGV